MARSHCWPGLVLVLQCAVRTVDHERTNQVGGTSFPSASQWHSFVLTLRQTMWREFGVEHHPSGSAVLCSVFKVAVNDSLYHSSSSPWRTKDCWSRLQLNELVDNFCTLYHLCPGESWDDDVSGTLFLYSEHNEYYYSPSQYFPMTCKSKSENELIISK